MAFDFAHYRPSATAEKQASAVQDLIRRVIPGRADEFNIVVDPNFGPKDRESFRVSSCECFEKIKLYALQIALFRCVSSVENFVILSCKLLAIGVLMKLPHV